VVVPFNRLRLLHLALIVSRVDSPLLDLKFFTNTFCTLSLTLIDKFNETFLSPHVNSMFVNKTGEKYSTKLTKILSLSIEVNFHVK